MNRRVYITGIGIISSIGNNVIQVLHSLRNSESGIGDISILDTVYKNILPIAEVKLNNEQLLQLSETLYPIKHSRTSLLGLIAAREAMQNAGISKNDKFRTGLISATSVGGMDKSEKFYRDFYTNHKKGRLSMIMNHECADSTEKIAAELGIKHFVSTISTACSSSANSLMFGARLIKNNILDRVIAGGTDAVTKFTLNGFNSLMILDKDGCKPFDEHRNGLTLGEGAGFLVLESEEAVQKTGKKVLAELTGYGNACDAYHQTASSPEGNGAFLAMKKAIGLSGLLPDAIDYINVHGTGTQNNDLSEGTAMERIFGSNVPPFSSTKAFTGHTLGAAGGIEAVISVLSINHQLIFPNLNFSRQMKELQFKPVTRLMTHVNIRNVLSNSFGFGGNNTALVISKA
jgi:3-oxoacyl-[acyl-carrier-protein] synthase-1